MARHYSEGRAAKRGKLDGRDYRWIFWPFTRDKKEADPPIESQEPSEYQEELITRLKERVDVIEHKNWGMVNEKLKEACQKCRTSYMDIKGRLKSAETQAGEELRKAKEALSRFPIPRLSMTSYWIIFIFITAGEMFFNALVFNIFGESAWHNAIMALGLIVAIPVLAHAAGRQFALEKHEGKEIFLMILEIAVVLCGLIAITIMREKYLVGTGALETVGIKMTPELMSFIFLFINLVLFVALFIIAYESGHKDPSGFKNAVKAVNEAETKLKGETGINAELAKKRVETLHQWTKAHADRKRVFESAQKKIKAEITAWIRYIGVYQSTNMAARNNKTKPASFKVAIDEVQFFPPTMKTLECNGCQYEQEVNGI
jgi:hypothetical protein